MRLPLHIQLLVQVLVTGGVVIAGGETLRAEPTVGASQAATAAAPATTAPATSAPAPSEAAPRGPEAASSTPQASVNPGRPETARTADTASTATEPAAPAPGNAKPGDDAAGMAIFLDRLMLAESGGNDLARNPRSTALGPFQFIESTFIEVVRRNFNAETATLAQAQVLALRTDRAFSRKAAEAYTRENAAVLTAAGITPTFAHLRLAYLVGPAAAVRVIRMPPQTPATLVLGPAAIRANPFMTSYTTADLIARAAREVSGTPAVAVTPAAARGKGTRAARAVTPACNLRQPSCRRWLALAERRLGPKQQLTAR